MKIRLNLGNAFYHPTQKFCLHFSHPKM